MPSSLSIVYDCFCAIRGKLSDCDRLYGPQQLNYLLSGPLQKSKGVEARGWGWAVIQWRGDGGSDQSGR